MSRLHYRAGQVLDMVSGVMVQGTPPKVAVPDS